MLHAKYVHLLSLSPDIGVSFVPVHLRFLPPSIGLRNERLALQQPQLDLPFANVGSNRGLGHFLLSHLPRIRHQIRCAVCRCFRGAVLSASRIASTKVINGSNFGLSLSGVLRFTGTALSTASRTIRR